VRRPSRPPLASWLSPWSPVWSARQARNCPSDPGRPRSSASLWTPVHPNTYWKSCDWSPSKGL